MRLRVGSWICAPTQRSARFMSQAHMQALTEPQQDVIQYIGSERATDQDGQQLLHLDLRQHAQAGRSVMLRLLALRPKGQLQLQSCTWTPALPPNETGPATLAGAAAAALPQTASAQGAAQALSQHEQLRGMLKQQMDQQPGLHAALRGDGGNGTATSPSPNAGASSGAQPAGHGGLAALAAMFGTAGARAPDMDGSSPQHLGSSPPSSSSAASGDATGANSAAATRGPAGGPMQALMGAIAKGMLLKDQKERIASQQAAALQAPQQDTGPVVGPSRILTMLADQNVLLERILAAQEATVRRQDAQDERTNELVALVAKVAEGVVQLQERQEGIADTLSQLRRILPSSEQDGRAFDGERAPANEAPSI